ncbi:glycosyltransferase family 2 protein [Massilia aerilata]|uniref:Glycosyltransferase family 2 protein n=1 Tax=Massilia aerilata TaxID=453817 RepID=A0ABW0S315_9BURK
MEHPAPDGAGNFPACRLAVVLSCFNRRPKTLEAIGCVLAQTAARNTVLDFFVTDDNSTDGSAEAILQLHPATRLFKGDGKLFWNGGMRLAWDQALKGDYDFYLWLNDDTFMFPHALQQLLDTHARCLGRHGRAGIVIGSTCDDQWRTSYGGERQRSRLRPLSLMTIPVNGEIQSCDTFNGNCVLVSRHAAAILGNLDGRFVHAIGDTDYGLRAKQAGIPMWVMPHFAGRCVNDHTVAGSFSDPAQPLRLRLRQALGPKGLPWKPWLVLCRRHAGPLWPAYWLWPYLKILATSVRPGRTVMKGR